MTLRQQARELAAQLNSADFSGDRWSVSMELSRIYKRLGALGVDAAHAGAASEEECE